VGNHKVSSAKVRAGNNSQHARESTIFNVRNPRAFTLRDWPVSTRLLAVIVLALLMGLVFGGLRVAAAESSASQFGRVSQLAELGEQVTVLVQDLQNERDETLGYLVDGNIQPLTQLYGVTDGAVARVQGLAAGVGGSFPANIQTSVAAVLSQISGKGLNTVRETAKGQGTDALGVIADYATPIGDMITLNDEIAQGTSDSSLANDVRTLNSLSLAKELASQQRALLFFTLKEQFWDSAVQQALTVAQSQEFTDEAAFESTATPAERSTFASTVNGSGVNEAEVIEDFFFIDGGDQQQLNAGTINPTTIGFTLGRAPAVWYQAMSQKLNEMQTVEQQIAGNIVARAQSLQQGAKQSALITAIITAVILLLVMIATLAVARSLVRPLRRLRAGALDIAAVQLPERVRQLSEAADPAASLEVAPIDVVSADEIGQVARAFDQVHAEAVRLAGNEAMLRTSFNAMFVNLSRRSQSLIERLARMIDSLEQNEDDPDRLSNLFSMDHLVTRMRRNSENLLLLAGHEGARKWSGPVLLTDVARAATSEIEQYSRVTLNVQPGVAISGQAVSDIVHLLAEVIENATTFSPKDTQVYVSAQELTSGGVLIEVSDSGVGLPDAMLAEMNWRLDNPPVIDVSVSRHMGLFAVARLAERHGVRVRLRARTPQGLTALVWLPDSVTERGNRAPTSLSQQPAPQASFQPRRTPGDHSIPMRAAVDGQFASDRREAVMPAQSLAGARQMAEAADPAGKWFRNPPSSGDGEPFGVGPQAGGMQTEADWWAAEGTQAAQIIADPVRGDHTAAGLPVRVPQANLIPGTAGAGRLAGDDANGGPAGSYETQTPSTPRPHRSPEMARNRLSGFQRGVRRGKGEALRAGEGADR
jgi:signal transduction histidine kinase